MLTRLLLRLGLLKPNMTVEAKVIRADGTVEDLGVIARGRVKLGAKAKG